MRLRQEVELDAVVAEELFEIVDGYDSLGMNDGLGSTFAGESVLKLTEQT